MSILVAQRGDTVSFLPFPGAAVAVDTAPGDDYTLGEARAHETKAAGAAIHLLPIVKVFHDVTPCVATLAGWMSFSCFET